MAARRAGQAKALASNTNLSTATQSNRTLQAEPQARLKSTSMTNLLATSATDSQHHHRASASRANIHRPASRNALDSIHKGMNAKFTHVQSKVLLQNIRPHGAASSKIPGTPTGGSSTLRNAPAAGGRKLTPAAAAGGVKAAQQQSDRSQLLNKLRAVQEELAGAAEAREQLRLELEREKAHQQELVGQLKGELETRARENERQNEEYHQKLLEAYELADQNRRAADTVLGESRQREEELRKRIEELEAQLAELKEFVAMKEEMMGKMGELREQMRVERERYEEKTRTLNQMFESEKISNKLAPEQSSNYFKRTKPAFQSNETIDRLEPDQQQVEASGATGRQLHQSEQDIYGSKLSTRMQDGAKFAWKKSRKFASSVITGSLGGLSACRKRGGRTRREPEAQQAATFMAANSHEANLHVLARDARGALEAQSSGSRQQEFEADEEHTSVIEVGEQQQQQVQVQLGEPATAAAVAAAVGEQAEERDEPQRHANQLGNKCGLIRVDENNKLTIVTKFNGAEAGECSQQQPGSNSGSERSRCESSSSGRGTASDSGSSGSQNGDAESRPAAQAAEFQCHKRKSSASSLAFKAASVLGDSQASLNKTVKSFFGGAHKTLEASQPGATATSVEPVHMRRQRNFDQAPVFDLANTTAFQRPPRLESFKRMGKLAGGELNNNEQHDHHDNGHEDAGGEHHKAIEASC